MKLPRFKSPNTRVIKHESSVPYSPDFIKPAKTLIPQWYKDDTRIPNAINRFGQKHIKHCVPFLDGLTTGYTMVTASDLYVHQEEGSPKITWWNTEEDDGQQVKARDSNGAPTLPIPMGCNPLHFVWVTSGAIELPKGYSALLTHPLNRFDLPFISLSAVVDEFAMGRGNVPFFIKEGFEGLIPEGTPYLQVIPFKRENWISKRTTGLWKKAEVYRIHSTSSFFSLYKRAIWHKKRYD